jgi:dTDP-4-dehydrorhamnose reductase
MEVKPDIVINCIAATSPDASFKTSFLVNSVLPIQLALLSKKSGYQTVHFSTNAVFSGKNKRNTEHTFSIPRSRYGISKLLGDLSAFRNLIIRTSFIGIPPTGEGTGGLVMKCKTAKQNDVIHINDNYLWNGLTIEPLVELVLVILKDATYSSGIFHIGASSSLTREELVNLILVRIGRSDLEIRVENRELSRNLTLQTKKNSEISSWWARTKYQTAPNLTELLTEAKFN